ncbi:unnamed protein product, partial [marine sediment metagenome]
ALAHIEGKGLKDAEKIRCILQRLNPLTAPVPKKAHREAVKTYGTGTIAKAKANLSKDGYSLTLEEGTLYYDWQVALKRQTASISRLARAPPSWYIEITTDPEKLGRDPKTGLPFVAAYNISPEKTLFIIFEHPYLFNLPMARQLEIPSRLIKYISENQPTSSR